MTDTTTKEQILLSTAAKDADDGGKRSSSNRKKRRLSKRERKNLKKQKSSSSTAADGVASTKSSSSNKKDHDHPQSPSQSSSKEAEEAEAPTLEEYMANYIPAPSAKITQENTSSDSKSLGKWFPKASVIKSSVCYSNDYLAKLAKDKKRQQQQQQQKQQKQQSNNHNDMTSTEIKEPKASLVLFYQYVNPTWSNAKVSSFLSYLTNIVSCHRTNIGGRIRVSHEGVNATVSAASFSTSTTNNNTTNTNPEFEAAQTLRHFTRDLQNFDSESFNNTDFKYIDGLSADRHFKEMKLLPVKELVFYGIREEDCAATATAAAAANTNDGTYSGNEKNGKGNEVQGGIHLDAKEYHEMLKRNDAVVIDVRNHYEAAIGRFDGQMETTKKKEEGGEREGNGGDDDGNNGNSGKEKDEGGRAGGGATYIDPKMRKSTDFTSWLAEDETKQKLEGKTVMMFCTGGIRCERASAYLNSQIGNKVNGVYQLKGGIERYLKEFPEGGFWRG
jgi:predicted sulfurtransferase